ncbi:lytic transglycosylase domain-containing protein [Ruminococcaceae bacterium OttesenSCG-928-O06]|nr:lytic transglycosylase domain-containing protein [Ruminococcaceae bacterium OttesenSCG-928-O06]
MQVRLLLAAVALVLLAGGLFAWRQAQNTLYPRRYTVEVEHWAAEYELDPLLLYAFVRTESSFNAKAESSAGARGLMQMTEDTFDWIKSRIARTEAVVYEDLYDADTAIRFGACFLSLCLQRYHGDVGTAAAAYHSGWTTVDNLLQDEQYSADGKTLTEFPYRQMNHYVNKITQCYQKYQKLYA